MTRAEIIERLSELKTTEQLNEAITHPAFDLFVESMTDYPTYGPEPCTSAWHWFREGWDSA